MGRLRQHAQPDLSSPVALIGFKGWSDAGEVASSTLSFVKQALDAQPLAELDPDPYYDFSNNRPSAVIEKGRLVKMGMPRNLFSYAKPVRGPNTVLFQGTEPQLNWNAYIDELAGYLLEMGTGLVICLGGTYEEILHTDPASVSIMADEMVLRESLVVAGGQLGAYKGPISIYTPFYAACREHGLPVVAIWGHSPVYVQNGNFKLVHMIMELVAAIGGPRPDLESLVDAANEMDIQMDDLIEKSPKLANYINKIANPSDKHSLNPPLATSLSSGPGKIIPFSRIRKKD